MSVEKKCNKCSEIKESLSFNKSSSTPDGLQYTCRDCEKEYRESNKASINARGKKYRDKNKVKERKRSNRWYADNKERRARIGKQWVENNRERYTEINRQYYLNNKTKYYAYRAKSMAAKLNATPIWANNKAIKSIYALSKFLTMTTFSDGYHVDHIIPLQGKNVCGLHVENNLQILRAKDNLSKGNRHAD